MLIAQIASNAPASTVSKRLIFRSAFPMIIFSLPNVFVQRTHLLRCKITNYSLNGKGNEIKSTTGPET